MGRIAALLRSIFTLGQSDAATAAESRATAIDARLAKIEADIAALASLVRKRDDRAQMKLKAGFSSLLNMVAILPELRADGVLPPFPHQGFEITGEEAAYLFHLVGSHRPKLVMELGSGSSTVLFAAALRANGGGRLISVEHDEAHAARTAQLLHQAGLSSWVEPVLAPLAQRRIGDRGFEWYSLEPVLRTLGEKIDLLFVDGPPGKMQSLSRYPALPVLAPHLAPRALVFVDDGGRTDEMQMIELWREIDDVAFKAEALDFLPHAPVLLTMTQSESRVATLRPREDPAEQPADDKVKLFGQGR